jgi:trimethylamine--corrinoid protein Co-methyltransferase
LRAAATNRSTGTTWTSIHEAVLTMLETVGFANAIPSCIDALTQAGAQYGADGRIRFPRALVLETISKGRAQLHPPRPG